MPNAGACESKCNAGVCDTAAMAPPPHTPGNTEGVDVAPEIVCVDCGGRCGLLSVPEPDWGFQPGDVVAYRCADCGDRWDLIVEDSDLPS